MSYLKDLRNALWDELEQLDEDHEAGRVTDQEYYKFKDNLLATYEAEKDEYNRERR